MKLGLLTTSFPRSEADAAGHFVLGFARALIARGHHVEVLAPEPHEAHFRAPPQLAGLDVRWISYLPRRHWQRTFYGAGVLDNLRASPLTGLGLTPFVAALARETRARMPGWDAVVSHWALPSALIAGSLAGTRPHLSVLHSADVFVLEQLPTASLRHLLASQIAGRASALLFSSRDLRRRFLAQLDPMARAEHAARAHVCPMGIDPAAASKEPRAALRKRLGLSRFTLLSLGRLIRLKGIRHAIEAVSLLPEVELVIAGYGPELAELRAEATRRGVVARFVGPVYGAEKEDWLRACDAFVLPSLRLPSGRTEGMPTTLLEAMDHGQPVIASDVGGVSDVVRSGENGHLVPPGQTHAIEAALRELLDPRVLKRLSIGARATAQLYHWSALSPLIEALLVDDAP